MKRPPRKHLRPVTNKGIGTKKFKRLIPPKKRIREMPVHRCAVLADLRRGSISSLDRYLAKNKGIPDREVALELRKLISGSVERTRYRIVVTEHPDRPKDVGGRPQVDETALSDRDREIADRYEELLLTEGKAYRAREITGQEFGLSESTVVRAIAKIKKENERLMEDVGREERMKKILQRRDMVW